MSWKEEDTVLFQTSFDNVAMDKDTQNQKELRKCVVSTGTWIDVSTGAKLYRMIMKLWKIKEVDTKLTRTKEQGKQESVSENASARQHWMIDCKISCRHGAVNGGGSRQIALQSNEYSGRK